MKRHYRVTTPALAHLDGIADYTLNEWCAEQMGTYLRALHDRFEWLGLNPRMGKLRQEIAPDIRSYREGSHLIFYRPDDDLIDVIGVLHQSMDIEAYFEAPLG